MQEVFVKNLKELESWLKKNFMQKESVWLVHYKFSSKLSDITRDNLVDTLLCYGWIDSTPGKVDDSKTKIRISPRRSKSIWSKINVAKVNRLIEEGKMKESGLEEVSAAKKDGRWDKAYDSPKNMKVPDDFVQQISMKGNEKALKVFMNLKKSALYPTLFKLSQINDQKKRNTLIKSIIYKYNV